jgi:hypothetical protein
VIVNEPKKVMANNSIVDFDFAEAPTVAAIKAAVAAKFPKLNIHTATLTVKMEEKTDDNEVISNDAPISYVGLAGLTYEDAPKFSADEQAKNAEAEAKMSEVRAARVTAKAAAGPVDEKAEADKKLADLKSQWKAFREKLK